MSVLALKSDEFNKLEKNIELELGALLSENPAIDILLRTLPSLRVKKALGTLKQTQDIFLDLGKKLNGKEKTLLDAAAYLFWVEVSTSLLADMLVIMLSTKGDPLHIEPDDNYRFTRHATTMDDLESPSVTLAMKLGYLNRYGIKCFDRYVDRTLRNRIAHGDFEINEQGDFFIHIKENGAVKNKKIDLTQKVDVLISFNSIVMHRINVVATKSKKQ